MSGRSLRRKFSRQFKVDIVEQMLAEGYSVAKLSAKHEIKPGLLYHRSNDDVRVVDPVLTRYEAVLRENLKLKLKRDLREAGGFQECVLRRVPAQRHLVIAAAHKKGVASPNSRELHGDSAQQGLLFYAAAEPNGGQIVARIHQVRRTHAADV